MTRVAGITTKKNSKGKITHVTIDVRKHKEAIEPFLEKLGVIEKSELQNKLENQKWLTVEELRESLLKKVDELWGK